MEIVTVIAPTPNKLMIVLRLAFSLQAKELERRILNGILETPDLTHWIERMAKMIIPSLQEYYDHGVRKTAVQLGIESIRDLGSSYRPCIDHMREIAATDGGRSYSLSVLDSHNDSPSRMNQKSFPIGKGLNPRPGYGEGFIDHPRGLERDDRGRQKAGLSTSIIAKAIHRSVDAVLHRNRSASGFNPKVIDAVNQAALHLCRETLETATTDVDTALERVRTDLKRHLRYSSRYGPEGQRGESQHILRSLSTAIGKIFNDPARAHRIAVTEYSRAVNSGAILEAKMAPFQTKKVWLSAPGSCKLCKALNGKKRKLDQPFMVLQEPGPYSIIQCPPYHPHCDCKMAIQRAA